MNIIIKIGLKVIKWISTKQAWNIIGRTSQKPNTNTQKLDLHNYVITVITHKQ